MPTLQSGYRLVNKYTVSIAIILVILLIVINSINNHSKIEFHRIFSLYRIINNYPEIAVAELLHRKGLFK